jgi:hypothetical protein
MMRDQVEVGAVVAAGVVPGTFREPSCALFVVSLWGRFDWRSLGGSSRLLLCVGGSGSIRVVSKGPGIWE